MTPRSKSNVNGIKSFERVYVRAGATRSRSTNKGVLAGRCWNMATGIAHRRKREKDRVRERKGVDLRGSKRVREGERARGIEGQ